MESRGPYFPRSAQYKRIEVEKLNKEKSKFFNDFFGLVSITKQNRPSSYIIVHTNHRDVHNWSSWFFYLFFKSCATRTPLLQPHHRKMDFGQNYKNLTTIIYLSGHIVKNNNKTNLFFFHFFTFKFFLLIHPVSAQS